MHNLGLSRPHCLLSAGASPPVCLSFAGWLLHRLLSRASALRHLLLRSHRTRPSSTPPLYLRQLVVATHLFAPPPPLDAPPPHDWLCQAVADVQALLPSSRLLLSPSLHPVKLASSPLSSSLSTSVAIVVVVVSGRAVAMVMSSLTSPVALSPSLSTSPSVAPLPSSLQR